MEQVNFKVERKEQVVTFSLCYQLGKFMKHFMNFGNFVIKENVTLKLDKN